MTKKIKLKIVKTNIDSNQYITNIKEIADEIIVGLKLKDNSGVITALLVGNNDNEFKNIIQKLVINEVYLIKGSTIILREDTQNEGDKIKNKIMEIIKVGDMFVAITAIKI